jgi:predicted permease
MPQILNILLTTIAPIILIAGFGAVLDRKKTIDAQSVSRVIIYLASPALAFSSIATSSINSRELGGLFLFGLLLLGGITLLSWLIYMGSSMDRLTGSAFILSASLFNGINYGVPVNEFSFGQPGVERAIILGVLSGIYANTVGIFLASSGKASLKQAFKNVLKVPMPYAAVLGLAVNLTGIEVPLLPLRITTILGSAAVPLMLLMLGIHMSRSSLQGQWQVIGSASLMRLVGGAMIGFMLAWLLGLDGITRQTAIIEASMPTAVVAGVLATEFDSDAELVSSIIVLSTLLSLLTLPVILLFVG